MPVSAEANIVGLALAPHRAVVEAGALRFFAKATGETRAEYLDDAAARGAGHRALPVPPSYFFCLNSLRTDHAEWRDRAGFRRERLLHGEQAFSYHRMAYAGDTLEFATQVADQYSKKNGALSFIVLASRISNQHGEHVADMRTTLAHRNA
ncbi:MAG: MaoC family dehydratase N-terminal domain-containing protein [Pseudomonadota bacterium]